MALLFPRVWAYLQPLRSAVGGGRPGVGLALLVQPGVVRLPGKGVDAPGAKATGGGELPVGDETRLHAQGLRATCRV